MRFCNNKYEAQSLPCGDSYRWLQYYDDEGLFDEPLVLEPGSPEWIAAGQEIGTCRECCLPPLYSATLDGDANAEDVVIGLTTLREDSGWQMASDEVVFTGSPDRIRIEAMERWGTLGEPIDSALQRVSPVLYLQKLVSASWTLQASAHTGYTRHTNDITTASNTICFTDPEPGTDPSYRLVSRRGSNITDSIPITLGHLTLEAV